MKHTCSTQTLFGFRVRTLAVLAALLLAGSIALGLDLMSEGRIYDYLWHVTGETAPHQQVLGFGQYLVRYTRQQPETQPYTSITHTDVNPFGVNTFLEQEVELEKRERQVQMIADAGFHWMRQQFPWEDIEIHGKNDFIDRRNVPDGISAWDKYDHIVGLAEAYDLAIMARLSAPPRWSQPVGVTNDHTPPEDFQDFVDYAVAVAERYRGRLHYYQVWNEPNLYPEWGDQTVNAEAYTDLLCRTTTALKTVDPNIVVITGALGPTVDLSGRNAYDLLYLQRMYQAGAGACFDILSVQGYGLWSGPTDRRLRQTTINYQRHLWIRDMMVANGDAHKAIWISEAGWNPVPNDPSIANLDYYGRVTMDEAAAWAPLAYARAIEEWSWIGVMNWWYFKPADEREINQSQYYFRLVEPDFTPTPVYNALKAYITGTQLKTLGAGRHGVQHHGIIELDDFIEDQVRYTFRIKGTGVYVCYDALPEALTLAYSIDDVSGSRCLAAEKVGCTALSTTLESGQHAVSFTAPVGSGLKSIVVVDYTARHRLPWILTGIVATLAGMMIVGGVVWTRKK